MADSGFWSLFWLWGCLICKALFAQLHSVKFNWILCFVSTLVWAKMNGHIRREWVLTVSMGIRRHSFSSYCVYIFERERQTGIHTHTHREQIPILCFMLECDHHYCLPGCTEQETGIRSRTGTKSELPQNGMKMSHLASPLLCQLLIPCKHVLILKGMERVRWHRHLGKQVGKVDFHSSTAWQVHGGEVNTHTELYALHHWLTKLNYLTS